jgi:hypothetical protein
LDPVFTKLKKVLNHDEFYNEKIKIEIDCDINPNEKAVFEKIINDTVNYEVQGNDEVFEQLFSFDYSPDSLINIDCGFGVGNDDAHCMFLCASMLLYGTTEYYRVLRQFFYFYYKSITLLKLSHPIFDSDYLSMVLIDITDRLFNDNPPLDKYYDNEGLLVKKYYRSFLQRFAKQFLEDDFWGGYNEFAILSSILEIEFLILECSCITEHKTGPKLRDWYFISYLTNGGTEYISKFLKKK